MNKHRTIYKRTSTGAIQTWCIEQDGAQYRTVSGQIDGAKVESGWKEAKPKNVGKANETTAEEQATLEVEAKYKKKLAQGSYHESVGDIDIAKFFKPMLAKKYEGWPGGEVRSQPKLDGVRCIANADGLWTRQGKPITAVPHISGALEEFFQNFPDAVLDGELYNHDLNDDFNKIISLVRKKDPSPERIVEAAGVVQYHIYDFPSVKGDFVRRSVSIRNLLDPHTRGQDCLVIVESLMVPDEHKLDLLYAEYIGHGYEGQMIRLPGVDYEQKRSKSLLKRKEFRDQEFTIVSIDEGKGNRSGMAGFITYELGDGREFGSGIKGSHEYCKQLLADADKYVGGTGTVQFFDYTPDGVPRFPVTVAVFEGGRDV